MASCFIWNWKKRELRPCAVNARKMFNEGGCRRSLFKTGPDRIYPGFINWLIASWNIWFG